MFGHLRHGFELQIGHAHDIDDGDHGQRNLTEIIQRRFEQLNGISNLNLGTFAESTFREGLHWGILQGTGDDSAAQHRQNAERTRGKVARSTSARLHSAKRM